MKYTEEFEAFWVAYPKRAGPNPKCEAFNEWSKRLAEGYQAEEMIHGARCYEVQCQTQSDRRYIAHARRFLRNLWFEDYNDTTPERIADEQHASAFEDRRGSGRRGASIIEIGARVAARGGHS